MSEHTEGILLQHTQVARSCKGNSLMSVNQDYTLEDINGQYTKYHQESGERKYKIHHGKYIMPKFECYLRIILK